MHLRALAITTLALPSLLAVPSKSAAAQATITVAVQDPVYRDLDRLFDSGLLSTMLVGQRPYSRREVARLIAEASASAARGTTSPSPTVLRILERVRADYAPELRRLAGDTSALPRVQLDGLRAEALSTNSLARAILPDSTGRVDADLNPLLNGRAGRTYRPGMNLAAEADLSVRVADGLVFRVGPRFVMSENAGTTFAEQQLQTLSATLTLHNVAIEAGRQQFVWGEGMDGALLASTSGRPLDMVRISNDTPWYAPSFLRIFGPLRGTVVAVDLGPNQRFPHSVIAAYKLSGTPFTWRFGMSISVLSNFGGRGAPGATFGDYLVDLIPAIKYSVKHKNYSQFSNKFAGWEYHYLVPEWRGLRIYAEHQFDDMDPRRWRSTLWQDGGHIVGVSLLRLTDNVSGSIEYRHTGLRYYRHGVFTSGIAFNRTLLGDPLGPQGDGGYVRLTRDAGQATTFSLDAAWERRGGDVWTAVSDGVAPHETNFRFVLLDPKPAEGRYRAVGTWTWRENARWRTTFQAGYERVRNFGFVENASRNNVLAAASIDLVRW